MLNGRLCVPRRPGPDRDASPDAFQLGSFQDGVVPSRAPLDVPREVASDRDRTGPGSHLVYPTAGDRRTVGF